MTLILADLVFHVKFDLYLSWGSQTIPPVLGFIILFV